MQIKGDCKRAVALPGAVYGTVLLEAELPSCQDKILSIPNKYSLKKNKFINKILI